jgi:hypothetical protein
MVTLSFQREALTFKAKQEQGAVGSELQHKILAATGPEVEWLRAIDAQDSVTQLRLGIRRIE